MPWSVLDFHIHGLIYRELPGNLACGHLSLQYKKKKNKTFEQEIVLELKNYKEHCFPNRDLYTDCLKYGMRC